MRSADGVIAHLLAPYDPVKAHEYYLRTRQLKGRQAGAEQLTIGRTSKAAPLPAKKPAKSKKQTAFEAQIAALQGRLEKLRTVLAELTKQAQARSGVTPTAPAKSGDKPTKQTSKQKAAAAKKAKAYYEKHKNDKKTPSQQVKELETKIKAIQAKIKKMKAEIAAADKKKHKTGSVGASK